MEKLNQSGTFGSIVHGRSMALVAAAMAGIVGGDLAAAAGASGYIGGVRNFAKSMNGFVEGYNPKPQTRSQRGRTANNYSNLPGRSFDRSGVPHGFSGAKLYRKAMEGSVDKARLK